MLYATQHSKCIQAGQQVAKQRFLQLQSPHYHLHNPHKSAGMHHSTKTNIAHLHMGRRYACVLGITSIKLPAHAAHCCCDHIALLELTPWSFLHNASCLDAKNSWERHTCRRVTIANTSE